MKLFARIITLMCIIAISAFAANGQTANFSADYTAGCAPLVVHFTNTSTGASSYYWDLGNTTTSTIANPSTSYINPGTYTVKLTATSGGSSSTKTMVITVYPVPTVAFSANDTAVCPGTPVVFTSNSLGGVAGPLTYQWNFGDGYSGSGATPTHIYSTSGYFNITLSVINSQGCVSSLTRTAYMHVYNHSAVNFNTTTPYSCAAPATVTFGNGTSGLAPLSYFWSFGDGGTGTATTPAHTYGSPGVYTIKLIVTDGNGCIDSLTRPSYVTVANLTASFNSPASACVNTPVGFNNTSGTVATNNWDFGDGAVSGQTSPGHAYSSPGTYTVRLIVFDGQCYDTVYHTITIQPGPVASFTMNPAVPCPAPATILFNGSVPPGATVTWLYGDGATGTGPSTSHTYASNGIDSIQMIVVSASGCKDTVLKVDTLYNILFEAIDSPSAGCVPLTVYFNTKIQTSIPALPAHPYPYSLSSWSWNFGDGSPVSTAPTPSHTYTAVGVYDVVFTGFTTNGCPVTDTIKVYVGTPPTVAYTASPLHTCANGSVVFHATHTGPVTVYTWQFGDGGLAVDSIGTTSHTYVMPGIFSPTVTAWYNGCPSTPYIITNYVQVDSPTSQFTFHYLCVPPTEVLFQNQSLGADSWLWIFGDGTTSTLWNPSHVYPSLSSYTVQLATYNNNSGCRDTSDLIVNLSRPIPNFTANDTAICRDQPITFTPAIIGGSASAYWWYVDGILKNDTSAIYTDTFHIKGYHTIMLVIMDNHGCLDTLTKTNYIIVAKPIANFLAAPPSGCLSHTVTFTDQSTDVPGATVTNFSWTYGDGATAVVTNPVTVHTYTAIGVYSVQEIVTDNIGCKDTIVKPNLIKVSKAHASFYASSNHPCGGAPITFVNTSLGVASSEWFFGDGTTSTLFGPTHTYTGAGNYTVTLVIVDTNGCRDTAKLVNYIAVSKPHAAFNQSDTVSICAPLTVNFTSTSTNAVSYLWSFGDGNASISNTPTDLYIAPGIFPVQLVVTDIYGCTDTATSYVRIYGYAGAFSYTPLKGCAPLTVFFNATINNVPSIVWDFADGTTSPPTTLTSTTHVYSQPGAYIPRLVLSDNTGCQSSSPGLDTIKVDQVTAAFNTSALCQNTIVNLFDTSTSYWDSVTSLYWTFNGDTSTAHNPSFFAGTAGTYTVTLVATDGWGCIDTLQQQLTVHPPPLIDAGPDTVICVGDAATLTASGGVTYIWANGTTLSCTNCNPTQATPPVVTTYTVTGTDVYGCVNTDTVTVYLKTKTVSTASGAAEVCAGTPVRLFDSGATKFTWIPAVWLDDPASQSPTVTPFSTITYTVIAQLASCIPDTNYVTITVHSVPTVDAGPDQTLMAGSSAQLHATGQNIYAYTWSPSSSLSCETCENPIATMSVTTTYAVNVTTDYGCTASDSVTIFLFCDESQIFIPNSFTPNGDGQNDVFYPRGAGISNIKSFRIYNRWGQLLFERLDIPLNDVANAWDGSYGGMSPRPDVYVYVIDALCVSGQPIFIKGDVTIIR